MSISSIDDRRDVAHPTNPIGGKSDIVQDRALARPLAADADRLPQAGSDGHIAGLPDAATENPINSDPYGGLPHGTPPARNGESTELQAATQADPDTRRVDPRTRLPDLPTSNH